MTASTLWQIFSQLLNSNGDNCVYAALPWTKESSAVLIPLNEQGNPAQPVSPEYSYFLEVPMCKELIEDLSGRGLSPDKVFEMVVHYATYDAFPDLS